MQEQWDMKLFAGSILSNFREVIFDLIICPSSMGYLLLLIYLVGTKKYKDTDKITGYAYQCIGCLSGKELITGTVSEVIT
jgi:hypothetical protein